MSNTMSSAPGATSEAIASEIRAEIARQGLSLRSFALQHGFPEMWFNRRVRPKPMTALTVDEVVMIAEALGVSLDRLLPRLDSNQQPFGNEPLAA